MALTVQQEPVETIARDNAGLSCAARNDGPPVRRDVSFRSPGRGEGRTVLGAEALPDWAVEQTKWPEIPEGNDPPVRRCDDVGEVMSGKASEGALSDQGSPATSALTVAMGA